MGYAFSKTMTPKRIAWLQALAEKPQPRHGHGTTGFVCMKNGWTQWVAVHADGRREGMSDLCNRYRPDVDGAWGRDLADGWTISSDEMLTEAGSRALQPHKGKAG